MILHVDMDAFYASVEERERPGLAGKPVIVGGTPEGRGVVAAANYEARRFGVHSAMPAARARRLCPHGVFLASRIELYAQVSEQIREIFQHYTPLVEPLSLDEAFLDVTGSEALFGTSLAIGRAIKQEIRQRLQLVASVGVAPNKYLAKIASDLDKPDGFVVVNPERIEEFLDPLPVGRLWGVGRVTSQAFDRLGLRTIRDVRQRPLADLQRDFGELGKHIWELARGIDQRAVVPDREAKSISHETTFARDIGDKEILKAWLVELSEQVAWRMRRHKLQGRTVHLKVRFSDFRTITRARTLAEPTNMTQEIVRTATDMLESRLPAGRQAVRLLGLGVSGFGSGERVQRLLFPENERELQTRLDQAVDQIREQFGSQSLNRASGLLHGIKLRRPSTEEPDER